MKSLLEEISNFDLTEQEVVSMLASNLELMNAEDVCRIIRRTYELEAEGLSFFDQAEFLRKTVSEINILIKKKGQKFVELKKSISDDNKYVQAQRKLWD